MRTDDRDSPSSSSNAGALDEFAAETADQLAEKSAPPDGVFCFESEAEPEPELSVNGTLLEIAPAAVSHSDPEPLSRIEARSARRRRSVGRRLATRFVAERNLITEAGSTIKDSAERASTAAARRVAAARERSGDLAAGRVETHVGRHPPRQTSGPPARAPDADASGRLACTDGV